MSGGEISSQYPSLPQSSTLNFTWTTAPSLSPVTGTRTEIRVPWFCCREVKQNQEVWARWMRRSNTANEETTPPKMTFCSLDCRNKGSFRTSELYLCLVLHSQGHFQGCPQELAFFLAELIKRAQHIWTADSAACVLSKENVPRES